MCSFLRLISTRHSSHSVRLSAACGTALLLLAAGQIITGLEYFKFVVYCVWLQGVVQRRPCRQRNAGSAALLRAWHGLPSVRQVPVTRRRQSQQRHSAVAGLWHISLRHDSYLAACYSLQSYIQTCTHTQSAQFIIFWPSEFWPQ